MMCNMYSCAYAELCHKVRKRQTYSDIYCLPVFTCIYLFDRQTSQRLTDHREWSHLTDGDVISSTTSCPEKRICRLLFLTQIRIYRVDAVWSVAAQYC
jgi:hypothetical protein